MFQVRGILNKLTPEKFQKLSDDLLGLELDSDKVLKGVILLIFEKALDEPKYSSMYAQLCKRLSEEAPNLEPPGQPCTFKLLLLNKCRAEFENRAQAFAALEGRAALTPEDEEKRHLAKCKMLGNIKFIGELGKLEILAESILHRCIQNLLARRAAAEHHEDLECLAQLVKTCGRVLDSKRGRGLMEQYFARMETLSRSRELAPRIRFMLRDAIELRRGGWVPRAAVSGEGPVPIQQLRADEEFHSPPPPPGAREPLFRAGLRARGLDDVLSGLALSAPAAPLVPPDKLYRSVGEGGGYRRAGGGGHYGRSGTHRAAPAANNNNKDPPPRFSKTRLPPGTALDDVQMRPAANSLLFTANRLSRQPPPPPLPLPLPASQQGVLSPAFASGAPLLKEAAITIKQERPARARRGGEGGAASGATGAGGAAAVGKEEACRLALAAAAAWREAEAEGEAAARALRDLQLPDKCLRRAVAALLEHALTEEGEPAAACCAVVRAIKRAPVVDAVRALLPARHPHPALHKLLAHAVLQKLVTLSEVGGFCEGGQYYPLLLEVLQQLSAAAGMERLQAMFAESKLQLARCVAAGEGEGAGAGEGEAGEGAGDEGGEAALAEAVEARGLGPLAPQLRVRADLARALQREPAPAALYRWIKANVEPAVRQNAAFVSALVALLVRHIAQEAPEREKALVEAYAPLLAALLHARPDLQLAAVYAVQVHAHRRRYPKGLLLRWFMYLYNLEVCEEDAFLRWREDVTDAYPGKGEALFQVNTWLTWLQQQESEDEEAED